MKNLLPFLKNHWFSLTTVAVAIASFVMNMPWELFVVGLVLLTIGAVEHMKEWDAQLLRRGALPSSPVWHVYINDISVGTISDAQYANLLREAIRTPYLYFAQAIVVLRCAISAIGWVAVITSVLAVGTAIAVAFYPADWNSVEVRTISAADFIAFARMTIQLALLIAIVLVMILAGVGGMRFGYKNTFLEHIKESIRLHLKCAARGHIQLYRLAPSNSRSSGSLADPSPVSHQ